MAVTLGGCSETIVGPTLVADDVQPDLFCSDLLPQTVELHGKGFAPLPTKTLEGKAALLLPKVEFLAAASLEGAPPATASLVLADDPANPEASAVHFESEALLKVDLAKGQLAPGVYDVKVTNPDNTTVANWTSSLAIVPTPELEGFDAKRNALVCLAEGEQSRTVTGKWFARVDGKAPTLRVGDAEFAVTAMDGCTAVDASLANTIELCTSLTFALPKDALPNGVYKVAVTNPGPVGCGAATTLDLAVVPPPKVLALVPSALCDDGADKTITVEGEGFLAFDGNVPAVTLGGQPAMLASAPMDCAAIDPAFPDVQTCNQLVVSVPKATLYGEYEFGVTNPAPVACSAMAPSALSIAPVPTVDSVDVPKIRTGGGVLTVTGSGFWVDSKMNPPTVELVPNDGSATLAASVVQCLDCDPANNKPGTKVVAQFTLGATPGVTYQVNVTNSGGCVATGTLPTIDVEAGPQLFLADPFVVPNEINTRVTLYATKLSEPLPTPAVWLLPAGMMAPQIDLTALPVDPAFPKRLQVIVPKGTLPGIYDVYLQDGSSCPPTMLKDGLTVTNKEDLSLTAVSPPFGAVATNTAITVTRNTVLSKAKFLATPRDDAAERRAGEVRPVRRCGSAGVSHAEPHRQRRDASRAPRAEGGLDRDRCRCAPRYRVPPWPGCHRRRSALWLGADRAAHDGRGGPHGGLGVWRLPLHAVTEKRSIAACIAVTTASWHAST